MVTEVIAPLMHPRLSLVLVPQVGKYPSTVCPLTSEPPFTQRLKCITKAVHGSMPKQPLQVHSYHEHQSNEHCDPLPISKNNPFHRNTQKNWSSKDSNQLSSLSSMSPSSTKVQRPALLQLRFTLRSETSRIILSPMSSRTCQRSRTAVRQVPGTFLKVLFFVLNSTH